MGDGIKTYNVVTEKSEDVVYAGSVSFTVSGDLVFEDETRNFQVSYAKGFWKSVAEVKETH